MLVYLYAPDVAAYRAELITRVVTVSLITHPPYMPEGEFRIDDPDGYCLLVGQSDGVSLYINGEVLPRSSSRKAFTVLLTSPC